MTLREQRCLFTKLKCELIISLLQDHSDWQIAEDEGTIHTPRKVSRIDSNVVFRADDEEHISNSFHHSGRAVDLLLYIYDEDTQRYEYIEDGNHPAWREISQQWKAMNSQCTAGIDFGDANHLSFGEGK